LKILLINPAIRVNAPPYNFPTGLGIIAAIMLREGHDVIVYDENALRPNSNKMLHELSLIRNIDIVGVGGLITTYAHVKRMVPVLRDTFPKAKFVLGGGVTVEPAVVFKNIPVDFCVQGEGEHTFRDLCSVLAENGGDISDVAGISYINHNGNIVATPPRVIEMNLDKFPMPAYQIFPAEIYFNNNILKNMLQYDCGSTRCASLMWSRGCPNQCTFCWRMTGGIMRFRSINLVMDEIEYLRSRYAVDSYLFYDECINADRKRATEFAQHLTRRGFAAPWYSHARVTGFDDKLAKQFRDSGCIGLNFGVESANKEMLAAMKKNATPEQASKAVKIARKAGIDPRCTFIVGMPGETRDTIQETIRWIRRHKVNFGMFFATPYPGCELYYQPFVHARIKERYNSKDAFFSILGDAYDLSINLTEFNDDDLINLRDKAIRKALFGKLLFKLLMEPRRWIPALMKRIGLFKQFLTSLTSKEECR
jgi:radical SAM superfamily enzyme YgiQ (UPF0313 family)